MISFSEPFFLYLLVPVTVAFLVWSAVAVFRIYSRPKISYGSKYPLLGKVKLWGLFVLPASVFMVLALAKPIMPGSSVRPSTGDIQVVLLLDSSISMRADDVRPSRLEIAKREISRMGAMLREGDKVALFTFGKSSNRKLYLTKDLETFFDQVERISFPTKLSNDESVWSTDFATALEHIYQSMDMQDSRGENYPAGRKYNPKKRDNRIVIIFSDGEDQMLNSMPANEQEIQQKAGYIDRRKKVLAEYKKRGLKIYPVGVGTSRGVKWLSLLKGYKKFDDYPESLELDQNWGGQVSRLDKANLLGIANSTGVQLGGYDWTVESYQDRAQNYLERVIDSNRRPLAEFTEGENDQNLWQYCLLISVAFLFLGFATYPFRGYFRKT